MLNQVVIVGRMTENPTIKEGETKTIMNLAVNRSFKNADGIYETDLVPCILWEGIATNVMEYCHKGDVVGVRGRLESVVDPETNTSRLQVIAEKVSFLSSKAPDKE